MKEGFVRVVAGSYEPRPEGFVVDDPFHVQHRMCDNCGLVFDFQFESGEDELPGRGWPAIVSISSYRANEDGEYDVELQGYELSCPRCGQDLNKSPPVPVRVSPRTTLSDLSSLIEQGEGQTLDFKESWPETADTVARLIASFATTEGGYILFGVNNRGNTVGYPGIDTPEGKDSFQQRIRGVLGKIEPAVMLFVDFFTDTPDQAVALITVRKGPRKIYTVDGRVYIRVCEQSRRATPEEIERLCSRASRG